MLMRENHWDVAATRLAWLQGCQLVLGIFDGGIQALAQGFQFCDGCLNLEASIATLVALPRQLIQHLLVLAVVLRGSADGGFHLIGKLDNKCAKTLVRQGS